MVGPKRGVKSRWVGRIDARRLLWRLACDQCIGVLETQLESPLTLGIFSDFSEAANLAANLFGPAESLRLSGVAERKSGKSW